MLNATALQPNAHLRKNTVARWKFFELALRSFVGVGHQCRDVDERGHPRVLAGMHDQRAVVGVADEDDRTGHASETSLLGCGKVKLVAGAGEPSDSDDGSLLIL